MKQQELIYHDGDQTLVGQLFVNDIDSEKYPGIIIFPAFEGLANFACQYASTLAQSGYVVLVADMYGDGKTADTIEGCMALYTPFANDRALVRRRAIAAFNALSQQASVDTQRIGAAGFCFGGLCALELMRSGADIKALVGMHSGLAQSDLPTEPTKASVLMLHGYEDPQVPPDQLTHFAEEMNAAGISDWTFTFYGHAQHSFTDPRTGTFDPEQEKKMGRAYHPVAAKRAMEAAHSFFNEILLNGTSSRP